MALTYEQFKKAKESGLSTEQIVEFEKRRTKESQVGQKIQTQTEQPSGILSNVLGAGKAVGGFLGGLAKDMTKSVASNIVSPIQLAKTAKNYYGDEDVQKRASEAMRGIDPDKQAKHTDDLYKALKTAETEEEKASIIKLMQEDLNKYVKEVEEKPIKEEVDTSVTLPFYGEIEAPKTAKEVAGRALETAALGAGGTAKVGATAGKSLFKRALTGPGSKIGATYSAGSALSENKSLGETAIQAGIGGILGGATDLALIGGGKGLQKLGEKLQKPTTKTVQQAKEEIAGRVITGKTKDRAVGVKALESIDTKNVKTFKDLEDKFSSKIIELSKKVDKKLEKDISTQKLKDLTTKAKSISGKEVKTNYVKTALEHLQEVYKKTGDNIGVQNIKDTIKKATTTGLTKKEINNIARSYGVEFGKKAFSKTGEPLTSVNSKLYESVRRGIKDKARETAAGLGIKEMDKTMSAIYRTRDLVAKNKEQANKLQQKIQERGLGEKLGRSAFNVLNMATMGGLKGFIERGMGRGTGLKTLNYIELDKNIAKNLKLLEKANKSKTKIQLEKVLNEIAKNVGVGISKTGEVISKIPGIAEEAPRKSVQSLMDATRTKMPIGMTIKDVSKQGFNKAAAPEKLIQEARKYKSAEEFVKAQGTPVYHSSSEKFANGKPNFDAYFGDADWKKAFSKEFGVNEYEVVLPKNKKILDLNKNTPEANAFIEKWGGSREDFYDEDWVDKYKVFPEVKKSGYDGAKFQGEYILSKDLINETKTKSQLIDIWNKANQKEIPYKETGSLTTKLLKKLEGKTTVSKQFIDDLTNSPDLKQVEKDLIRRGLAGEGEKINVTNFANKIKAELLPLKRVNAKTPIDDYASRRGEYYGQRYEGITLPSEIRGNVKNYSEQIYNSPIRTSAGSVHFDTNNVKNYFGHTRIEDMADNKTRRVIEVQSDLYQKGGLEKEGYRPRPGQTQTQMLQEMKDSKIYNAIKGSPLEKRTSEIAKLEQYNDPTAHFRMVREEISQAAKDKKTKVQFPTGETAMKIEGLGNQDGPGWIINEKVRGRHSGQLQVSDLKVGLAVDQGFQEWIITDVLGDGKFKAVPAEFYKELELGIKKGGKLKEYVERVIRLKSEEFDISGKVDTKNPIYKFYEKEMGKYLKSKYNAKEVIDDQGVSWYEVDIKPEMKGSIEAFGMGAIPLATQINQDKK